MHVGVPNNGAPWMISGINIRPNRARDLRFRSTAFLCCRNVHGITMDHIADTQSGIMQKLQSQSSEKQESFFWNLYRSQQDFIVQL